MKTWITATAFTIAAAAGSMLAAPAAADPPVDACGEPPCQRPANGCPPGFDSKSVPDVVLADPNLEGEVLAEDRNADNVLCFKLLPNGKILFMDNDLL